jgi:hypothetical protein
MTEAALIPDRRGSVLRAAVPFQAATALVREAALTQEEEGK